MRINSSVRSAYTGLNMGGLKRGWNINSGICVNSLTNKAIILLPVQSPDTGRLRKHKERSRWIWEKAYFLIISLLANNVLCMSSGTCTHFQISTNLSVPLLIHGVMCRFYSEYEKVSNNLCRPCLVVSMWEKSSRKKKYD